MMETINSSSGAATLIAPEDIETYSTEDSQIADAAGVRRIGTKDPAEQPVDRQSYVEELQDALSRIGQLHGLLYICTCCKRVGDGRDNWQEVRWPIVRYWESHFSQTFCPDCYETSIKPESALLFEYLNGDDEKSQQAGARPGIRHGDRI